MSGNKAQSLLLGIGTERMINGNLGFKPVFLNYIQNRHENINSHSIGLGGVTLTQPKSTHNDAILKN
jgi:hypothetical protein